MAERKEAKAKIKIRDLKPKKDAKGGSSTQKSGGHQINIVAGRG
jgi:hypothetical protein